MPTTPITNGKPAEATTPGGLNLVFSTTHPHLGKEQADVYYPADRARV